MKNNIKLVTSCRICKSNKLELFLDLGHHPPSDQFLTKEELNKPIPHYPLRVCLCVNCGLSQLDSVVSREILFQKDYPYDSSTTKTGKEHFLKFAEEVIKRFDLGKNDLAVDIGSNVGVLLGGFAKCNLKIIGIDPAPNIVKKANESGIETICDFFGKKAVREILKKKGKASVVIGTNVFAHIDSLDDFMKNLLLLLKNNGVFIIEAPYFLNLVKNLEYDTIYHEHLSYLSIKPLSLFFQKYGMEIFDVKMVGIHGGSFRVFSARKGSYKPLSIVQKLEMLEKKEKLHTLSSMHKFSLSVERNRLELRYLLTKLKKKNKKIAALSAPAKGMTLLNYCRIGTETLEFVTEKNPLKIGRFTPGGHIPVVPDSYLLEKKIEYALLLAWNFAPEIMDNLKKYKQSGGKFIIPIPKPQIF